MLCAFTRLIRICLCKCLFNTISVRVRVPLSHFPNLQIASAFWSKAAEEKKTTFNSAIYLMYYIYAVAHERINARILPRIDAIEIGDAVKTKTFQYTNNQKQL